MALDLFLGHLFVHSDFTGHIKVEYLTTTSPDTLRWSTDDYFTGHIGGGVMTTLKSSSTEGSQASDPWEIEQASLVRRRMERRSGPAVWSVLCTIGAIIGLVAIAVAVEASGWPILLGIIVMTFCGLLLITAQSTNS